MTKTENGEIAPQLDSNRFLANARTKRMSADAAELQFNDMHSFRAYEDACDVGFRVVNKARQTSALFILLKEDRKSPDNEVTRWVFVPSSATLRQFPALKGWQINVFND